MKQNDEQKDAKVMTQEELENVMGGRSPILHSKKSKLRTSITIRSVLEIKLQNAFF